MAKVFTTFYYDVKRKETYELDLKSEDDIAFFVEMWEQDPSDEREYTVSTCAPQLVDSSIVEERDSGEPNGEESIIVVCETDDEYARFCEKFAEVWYVTVLRQSDICPPDGTNLNTNMMR
jgi:hypothetical protein